MRGITSNKNARLSGFLTVVAFVIFLRLEIAISLISIAKDIHTNNTNEGCVVMCISMLSDENHYLFSQVSLYSSAYKEKGLNGSQYFSPRWPGLRNEDNAWHLAYMSRAEVGRTSPGPAYIMSLPVFDHHSS